MARDRRRGKDERLFVDHKSTLSPQRTSKSASSVNVLRGNFDAFSQFASKEKQISSSEIESYSELLD